MSTPNVSDLITGFDPTSNTTITGAQLAQMVNSATTTSDRGFVLVSTDTAGAPNVPNASGTGTTAWQRYIWLRIQPTTVTAYVWNPNGSTDSTFLNWVNISQISTQSAITNAQLAGGITSDKITSVLNTSILNGVPPLWLAQLAVNLNSYLSNGLITTGTFSNASFVWGDLTGNGSAVGAPVVSPLAITQPKLALQAAAGNATLVTGQVKDRSLYGVQLYTSSAIAGLTDTINGQANSGIAPQTINAVDPLNNISVPSLSAKGQRYTNANITGDALVVAAGDVLVVNGAKNGYVTNNRAVLNLAEPTSQTYLQIPTVAANGVVYGLSNPQGNSSFGRILQRVTTFSTAKGITNFPTAPTARAASGAALTTTNMQLCFSAPAFTPLSATSTIIVELMLTLSINSSAGTIVAGILDTKTSATAIQAASVTQPNSPLFPTPLQVFYTIPSWGTSLSSVFSAYMSSFSNQVALNSTTGSDSFFAGAPALSSVMIINEYL